MLILTASDCETARIIGLEGGIGFLYGPRSRMPTKRLGTTYRLWAADNDCFNGFDAKGYLRMLRRIRERPGCLFVSAPDVMADPEETLRLFHDWREVLSGHNLPIGLVAQDGLLSVDVPWGAINALFIGGTTEWKLSSEAEHLASSAKRRGMWLHMGRVNSQRRLRYARDIGCDSVDGTAFARWNKTHLPWARRILRQPSQQRLGP